MEKLLKLRCPYCEGKISADEECCMHLAGKAITCPHCAMAFDFPTKEQIASVIKAIPEPKPKYDFPNAMATTQRISPTFMDSPGGIHNETHCPHCNAVVGPGDRVCITCEKKIEQPAI